MNIVYKDIHSFDFKVPAHLGDVLQYEVTVVRVGGKTMTMRTGVYTLVPRKLVAEGYMTFVTIDEETGGLWTLVTFQPGMVLIIR